MQPSRWLWECWCLVCWFAGTCLSSRGDKAPSERKLSAWPWHTPCSLISHPFLSFLPGDLVPLATIPSWGPRPGRALSDRWGDPFDQCNVYASSFCCLFPHLSLSSPHALPSLPLFLISSFLPSLPFPFLSSFGGLWPSVGTPFGPRFFTVSRTFKYYRLSAYTWPGGVGGGGEGVPHFFPASDTFLLVLRSPQTCWVL